MAATGFLTVNLGRNLSVLLNDGTRCQWKFMKSGTAANSTLIAPLAGSRVRSFQPSSVEAGVEDYDLRSCPRRTASNIVFHGYHPAIRRLFLPENLHRVAPIDCAAPRQFPVMNSVFYHKSTCSRDIVFLVSFLCRLCAVELFPSRESNEDLHITTQTLRLRGRGVYSRKPPIGVRGSGAQTGCVYRDRAKNSWTS
jgi:hypothetical protein